MSELEEYYNFGSSLIARTRSLILSLWHTSSISSKLKEDNTPVSEVDLRCEELVRRLIRQQYPDHGVVGEELGVENEKAEFTWTIDPIDGTQNLINRIPTFGTILSLLRNGRPILGWIDHPILQEVIQGGSHFGTFHNQRRVTLADVQTVELTPNDIVGISNPAVFQYGDHLDVLWAVLKFHPHVRMYYDVYSHSLAVLGSLAAHVEYNLKIWDYAASQALVEAAGGVFREMGQCAVHGKPKLFHAVFGKPRAVELISAAIAQASEQAEGLCNRVGLP